MAWANVLSAVQDLQRKCEKDKTNIRYALLLLRSIPRDNTLKSPAERLFSRKTNIALPTTKHNLQPRIFKNVQSHLYNKRIFQKRYHDKTTKPLTDLTKNKNVRLQTEKVTKKLYSSKILPKKRVRTLSTFKEENIEETGNISYQ